MSIEPGTAKGAGDNSPAPLFSIRPGGWLWPTADEHSFLAIEQCDAIDKVVDMCAQRRTVIQAGGNCGVWPSLLAAKFRRVITFEPDWQNFHCLAHNTAMPNVFAYRAALGCYRGGVDLADIDAGGANFGAFAVNGHGDIPILRVDDFAIDDIDLIWLDVEGYEQFALLGAINSIRATRPLIVCEEKELNRNYGAPSPAQVLADWGYRRVASLYKDWVYQWTP